MSISRNAGIHEQSIILNTNTAEIKLENLLNELLTLIIDYLSLQDMSRFARTNKKMKESTYNSFTLFISPDTNKFLTYRETLDSHLRYKEIATLIKDLEPGRLSNYFTSLKFDKLDTRFLSLAILAGSTLLTGIASGLAGNIYDIDVDSESLNNVFRNGCKIALAHFLGVLLHLIFKNRNNLNFNLTYDISFNSLLNFIASVSGLVSTLAAIGAAPGIFAYFWGASSTTSSYISAVSSAISFLPTLTNNFTFQLIGSNHITGCMTGSLTGFLGSIPTSFMYGLFKGDVLKSMAKGITAATGAAPTIGSATSLTLLLTDYCGQRFFNHRNQRISGLNVEKDKIKSTLNL